MTSILKRGKPRRYPALPAIVLNVSALPNEWLEPIFAGILHMPRRPVAAFSTIADCGARQAKKTGVPVKARPLLLAPAAPFAIPLPSDDTGKQQAQRPKVLRRLLCVTHRDRIRGRP